MPEALVRSQEVLGKGGGAGVVFERLKPYIEAEDTSGFRFSMANSHKDLGYYLAMTEDLGAARGAASAILEVYAQACGSGHEQAAVPELIKVLSQQT